MYDGMPSIRIHSAIESHVYLLTLGQTFKNSVCDTVNFMLYNTCKVRRERVKVYIVVICKYNKLRRAVVCVRIHKEHL